VILRDRILNIALNGMALDKVVRQVNRVSPKARPACQGKVIGRHQVMLVCMLDYVMQLLVSLGQHPAQVRVSKELVIPQVGFVPDLGD
jgi:hypothetical protein